MHVPHECVVLRTHRTVTDHLICVVDVVGGARNTEVDHLVRTGRCDRQPNADTQHSCQDPDCARQHTCSPKTIACCVTRRWTLDPQPAPGNLVPEYNFDSRLPPQEEATRAAKKSRRFLGNQLEIRLLGAAWAAFFSLGDGCGESIGPPGGAFRRCRRKLSWKRTFEENGVCLHIVHGQRKVEHWWRCCTSPDGGA